MLCTAILLGEDPTLPSGHCNMFSEESNCVGRRFVESTWGLQKGFQNQAGIIREKQSDPVRIQEESKASTLPRRGVQLPLGPLTVRTSALTVL